MKNKKRETLKEFEDQGSDGSASTKRDKQKHKHKKAKKLQTQEEVKENLEKLKGKSTTVDLFGLLSKYGNKD